jgi:uncharacterized protein (TIGR02391 family)
MKLSEILPDPEALIAFEPEELGIRLLPFLTIGWPRHENLSLETLIILVNGHPHAPAQSSASASTYPRHLNESIAEALREAWAWLEGSALLLPHPNYISGSMRALSRKAKRLGRETTYRQKISAGRVSKDSLHQDIREDVWGLYHRGKYDTAVFEAMKAVEIAVREAARLPANLVGVKLMRAAFASEGGPLTDDSVEPGERVARMELFAGAIGSYKNPQSHRKVALEDPDEAAEIIMLANHLLRIVEAKLTRQLLA